MTNTYTWTCPRCGQTLKTTTPSAPANCPRCNYPDPSTIAETADPNADLEAEVGPEAQLAMTEEQLASAQKSPDWAAVIAGKTVEDSGLRHGQTFSIGDAHIPNEPGWLGEVMREVVEPYARRMLDREGEGVPENGWDWVGMAEGVIEKYNGDRPTLLCGCPAGKHPRTFKAIEEAHPERVAE